MLLSAILREFEVIGEAANNVSEKTRKQLSSIPWKELVGMRNRLIHAYFDIDREIVWRTIREYLPSFQKQVQEAIRFFERE